MSLEKIDIKLLNRTFVDDLMKDKDFFSLFESKAEVVDSVMPALKILEEFLEHHCYDTECYEVMGARYLKKGISFAATVEIVNFVQNEVVRYFELSEDVQQIIDLYEVSLNYMAKGYFYASFDQFLDFIKKRQNTGKMQNMQSLFMIHLNWLESIYLQVKKSNTYDAMLQKNCTFKEELMRHQELYEYFTEELEQIMHLHTKFHKQIYVLHYMLEKEDYIRAFELVHEIELLSVEIESSLSIINILDIEHQNKYDYLTGAMSRKLLVPILENEMDIVRIAEKSLIIAMLDIDDFKDVNDTYGHLCGDEVLKSIVSICKSVLRSTDYIFRYGGEEFILLLNAINFDLSINIFERIRRKIEKAVIKCHDREISVTVSIGIEHISHLEKSNLINSIDKADKNLYIAKKSGKNMIYYTHVEI
jgi:diguanylate cyclase (GGDEF)-like protein